MAASRFPRVDSTALISPEAELGPVDVVRELMEFVRRSRRGINDTRRPDSRPARRPKVDLREALPCG
jgi:hypothetical protein